MKYGGDFLSPLIISVIIIQHQVHFRFEARDENPST